MKFTFSNTNQILAMSLIWMVALFAVDYIKQPRPLAVLFGIRREACSAAVRATNPTITLWVNHLCCSGCLDDLRMALRPLTWADKVELDKDTLARRATNGRDQALNDFSNRVQIEIKSVNLARVDFVALDRTVRDAGLFAEHIEFAGIPHARLEAYVPHLCCNMCKAAIAEGVQITKQLKRGNDLKWLDSIDVNSPRKTVTAYARYDSSVDVGEFIAALNHLGFSPATLTVSGVN